MFAGVDAGSAAELNETWERQKVAEKGRTSAVDGVPVDQPALALTAKLVARARRHEVEVDPPVPDGIGLRLFALAREAVEAGLDPETELRRVARAYRQAILAAESAESAASTPDPRAPAPGRPASGHVIARVVTNIGPLTRKLLASRRRVGGLAGR